jgi:hypothetical protein
MLQAEEPRSRASAGGCCENCGAVGQDTRKTWCRQCGYYAVLGRCVELDQEWEAALDPNAQPETDNRPAFVIAFNAVPRWVWPVLGIVVLAIGVTLLGRMLTPANSMLRVGWAFLHLATAILAFLGAQVWACYKAAQHDSQVGLLDVVMRPIAIWKPAFADMPRSLRPLLIGVGGLTAAVAVLAIGGFPYNYIFEEEIFKARPERKLAQAIAIQQERMEQKKYEDELKALEAAKNGEKKEPERPVSQDCVIVGYIPSGSAETGFTSLLVAAPVGEEKELHFVATVDEGLTPEMRAELFAKFQSLHCDDPLVPCNVPGAMWVEPSLTCRIRFAEWTKDWFLKDPAVQELLQKVEAGSEE